MTIGMRKGVAISALIIISFILLVVPAAYAQTEQKVCCAKKGNAYCVGNTPVNECDSDQRWTTPDGSCTGVSQCSPGVCVPTEGACMAGKSEIECSAIGGSWLPGTDTSGIARCAKGCCVVAGGAQGCSIEENKICEERSLSIGKEFEFKADITTESACLQQCAQEERGTCIGKEGFCTYTTQKNCVGDIQKFVPNSFVYQTKGCSVKHCAQKACGRMPGDENKICCFDSLGNQEECTKEATGMDQCDWPSMRCSMNLTSNTPYCKERSCTETFKGSQEIDEKGDVKTVHAGKEKLLPDTSMCYNFYTSYDKSRLLLDLYGGIGKYLGTISISGDVMQGISTGLQNQIIHCHEGLLSIESLDTAREKLCKETNIGALTYGKKVTNNYGNCASCGEGDKGAGNFVADLFIPVLTPFPFDFNSMIGGSNGRCTEQKCKELGDCVYNVDVDSAWDRDIGSCDPRYPPGKNDTCNSNCGGGGDYLLNLCTRAECRSQGNCQFQQDDLITNIGTAIYVGAVSYYGNRVSWIPTECAIAATIGGLSILAGTAGYPFCGTMCGYPGTDKSVTNPCLTNCLGCLPDRAVRYVWGIPWTATYGLYNDLATIYKEVINVIKNALPEASTTAPAAAKNVA